MADEAYPDTVGWIGTGRMGSALVTRLLDAGVDVWAYNRTRSKADPLAAMGAKIVDSPAELAGRDIVFTMVSGPSDVREVTVGSEGGMSRPDTRPSIIIDSTTSDSETSSRLRTDAADLGTAVLAAPVSGNPKVVSSGQLTAAVSGPSEAYARARPYLELFGRKVTYVGEADEARLVKICHNLLLGVVTQTLAEILVLAEADGVSRADLMEFINDSVMGSTFSQYKTPALVNLDYTPTFTWHLLRKDFELGLAAGRELDVPLPTSALVHQIVTAGIGLGYGDLDFAAMLTKAAAEAGRTVESENADVVDGLD
jgi:3-hydroxyisobutyrate dehydrogenase-like beta-hydroxyacid dehydrogenase